MPATALHIRWTDGATAPTAGVAPGPSAGRGRVGGRWLAVAASVALLSFTACSSAPSALDANTPEAQRINVLSWVMFAMAGAVFLGVVGLMLGALFRSRPPVDPREPKGGVAMIVGGGVVLPVVALTGLLVLILTTATAVSGGFAADESAVEVEVIGRQWWWEVRYPAHGVVTANEVHIPAGRPVELVLTTDDVIHSFWVPQLHGKVDMVPGQENRLRIQAAEAGVFRGACAEFCGIQHAKMAFHVVASAPDTFEAWLAAQSDRPASVEGPALAGEGIFLSSSCAACHTVRGTSAEGDAGPDLTHLMSRQWLAAGTIENTPANLRAWVEDPQRIKPGNYMPDVALSPSELDAVIAYLLSLE